MQYYRLNKVGECKIKPTDFQILPAQVQFFSQIQTLQERAYAIHTKLSDKESFCHKISLKRGFRFDHDNWDVNNMERPLFGTEIEARRELARVVLINKHHYRPHMIQFDVLDSPRLQSNIEEKQGRFRLHRYRTFAFQHCRIFDVGRSQAQEIEVQKRYFIETLENSETNSGHKNMPHMYSSRFQKHLYDESALSRFEVLTKPLFKCNEDRPYYATQYQVTFIQHREGFNFVSGTPSPNFDGIHIIVPEGPPSLTSYTKANICA